MTEPLEEVSSPPTTFILVGSDINRRYPSSANTHILSYHNYPDIEDTIQQIRNLPARIILDCHGWKDSTFVWNKKQHIYYANIFRKLPREGIDCIVITSCHGSKASDLKMLSAAPPGAIIITVSANQSVVYDKHLKNMLKEIETIQDPINFFLKILNGFEPREYISGSNFWDDKSVSPVDAVPNIIGIGGKPPLRIKLHKELTALRSGKSSEYDPKPIDNAAWDRSVERVQDHLNSGLIYRWDSQIKSFLGPSYMTGYEEAQFIQTIADIAARIREGLPVGKGEDQIKNAEELKIAYALAAAYLDESGQIKKWRTMVKQVVMLPDNISTQMGAHSPLNAQEAPQHETGNAERKI